MQWDTILSTRINGTETNTTTPRGLLLRAWPDHPELPCRWSPHHEEMSVEWVALTRTSFYEGRLWITMGFPPRWAGRHSQDGATFFLARSTKYMPLRSLLWRCACSNNSSSKATTCLSALASSTLTLH
jgi:hypothetical protein